MSTSGLSVTAWTDRPWWAKCWPSSENEPPASMMKMRGRWRGHHLLEQVHQQGRFPGPGRAEDQHVRVLLAVLAVQRVEHQGLGAAVEEHESRMARAARAAVKRHQVGQVAREDQARAPPALVQGHVMGHRQVADIAVEGQQVPLPGDRLQAVGQQQRMQLVQVGAQGLFIVGTHVEGQAGRVQLVAAGHLPFHLLGILAGQRRLRRIAHRGAADARDVIAGGVLGASVQGSGP